MEDFEDVPADVYDYCTQFANDPFCPTQIKKIRIEDLREYSTSCGVVGNKPFDDKVIRFLKEHSDLEFVVVEVDQNNCIVNMAVKWKASYSKREYLKITNKFDHMILNNGGSLRAEEMIYEDKNMQWWDLYESE